jgi:Fic family protein
MTDFKEGLAEDIRKNLLQQLRVLWTHTSTAIEGNTLSLGETAFVLSEGLTISGKSLKEHRDIEGHARAIDVMYGLVARGTITTADLFDLHRLVISEQIIDAYSPIGGWKKENNSTTVTIGKKLTAIEFSNHWEIPQLMEEWLDLLNTETQSAGERREIVSAYARLHLSFVGIHPFFDGNGRIARLVANLPALKAGYPPIIIPKEQRFNYIKTLAEYQTTHGIPAINDPLIHEGALLDKFSAFCAENWRSSMELVEQAQAMQRQREAAERKALGSND